MQKEKMQKRIRRHKKVRAKVRGTAKRPRLCVFKSNTRIYAQLIDDEAGRTLLGVSDASVSGKTKTERASLAGEALAKEAAKKGVTAVVFDRGGYVYTGRVRAFADGARKGGLKF